LERNLKATRIYGLKPYENLQLTTEINNIPEELVTDNEIVLNLSKLQLIEMESQFNYYCLLREKTNKGSSFEEVRVILEEERAETIETLFDNKNFNEYLTKLVNKGD
jgi:hypothetical protein